MLQLFSPAKINLFLRIVSKRPDGYHNLSSVFQTISLGDTLTMEPHSHDELTCSDPHLPTDASNLVLKAIDLFRRKTNIKQAFRAHLHKRIPTQAGLGGGSSNAATTLWGCNQLMKANISVNRLQQWSAEIGSDIPFFFSEGTACCTGRGEHVSPLPSLPSDPLWIVKPAYGLSTPDVYRRLNCTIISSEVSSSQDIDAFLSGSLSPFNDLEKPAFEIAPRLKDLKNKLLQNGFDLVLMSGSGSAFFCRGNGTLPTDPGLTIMPVHFINRSRQNWYL